MKETEEIRSMIREINDTQVQPDEILSYSLYCYDREEGRMRLQLQTAFIQDRKSVV